MSLGNAAYQSVCFYWMMKYLQKIWHAFSFKAMALH